MKCILTCESAMKAPDDGYGILSMFRVIHKKIYNLQREELFHWY